MLRMNNFKGIKQLLPLSECSAAYFDSISSAVGYEISLKVSSIRLSISSIRE